MKIAFIWPHTQTVYQTMPLAFGILYSSIKDQGHDVRMFNLSMEGWTPESPEYHEALRNFQPDLIGISVWAVSFQSSVAAVQVARKLVPDAVIVAGGNYPTLNAAPAWESGCFDYLLRGEAEETFPKFVRYLEEGNLQAIEELPGIYFKKEDGSLVRNKTQVTEDLDGLAHIDYDFIELERAYSRGYMSTVLGPKRKVPMFATRGCEHACNFCAAPLLNGQRSRHWSVEYLTGRISELYHRLGVRIIYFMDDNATQDKPFFKDLCRGIAALGLKDLSVELYRGVRLENLDEEMLALMRQAGFKMLTIAPESGSERVRDIMKKDMDDADIRRVAKMIKDAGISLQAYFIIGYPGETAEEREESYRYIYELGLDVFSLHKYMALPGTASFLKLVRRGVIPRNHTDASHLIGESLPNYNGDLPEDIDREAFRQYVKFYARNPLKLRHLLHMASAGGLWRSISGTTKAALDSALGRSVPGTPLPTIRPL